MPHLGFATWLHELVYQVREQLGVGDVRHPLQFAGVAALQVTGIVMTRSQPTATAAGDNLSFTLSSFLHCFMMCKALSHLTPLNYFVIWALFPWHHWLNGHESEQTLRDGKGQGSLVCCSPWGHKESDRTEPLNNRPPPRKPWGSVIWGSTAGLQLLMAAQALPGATHFSLQLSLLPKASSLLLSLRFFSTYSPNISKYIKSHEDALHLLYDAGGWNWIFS